MLRSASWHPGERPCLTWRCLNLDIDHKKSLRPWDLQYIPIVFDGSSVMGSFVLGSVQTMTSTVILDSSSPTIYLHCSIADSVFTFLIPLVRSKSNLSYLFDWLYFSHKLTEAYMPKTTARITKGKVKVSSRANCSSLSTNWRSPMTPQSCGYPSRVVSPAPKRRGRSSRWYSMSFRSPP